MLFECAVDSERNGVINFVVSCSIVELFIHKNSAFDSLKVLKTIAFAMRNHLYCSV